MTHEVTPVLTLNHPVETLHNRSQVHTQVCRSFITQHGFIPHRVSTRSLLCLLLLIPKVNQHHQLGLTTGIEWLRSSSPLPGSNSEVTLFDTHTYITVYSYIPVHVYSSNITIIYITIFIYSRPSLFHFRFVPSPCPETARAVDVALGRGVVVVQADHAQNWRLHRANADQLTPAHPGPRGKQQLHDFGVFLGPSFSSEHAGG